MTVQAGIETVLDLELLVGDLEEQACESPDHDRRTSLHNGSATHYAKVHCSVCGFEAVKTYCLPFTKAIQRNCLVQCYCGNLSPAMDIIKILAPVKP